MAGGDFFATTNLQRISLNPEDITVNSWSFFRLTDPSDGDFVNLAGDLAAFYNAVPTGGTSKLAGYMSFDLSNAADVNTVKMYKRSAGGLTIGPPLSTKTWTLASASANEKALPSEVAVCCSFHAALLAVAETVPGPPAGPLGDTHPRSRRRGRVFLGPLNGLALSVAAATTGPQRVKTALRTDATIQMAALLTATAAHGWTWHVWSRKLNAGNPVVGGWVDDAFDTQRRRGDKRTTRTLWGTP